MCVYCIIYHYTNYFGISIDIPTSRLSVFMLFASLQYCVAREILTTCTDMFSLVHVLLQNKCRKTVIKMLIITSLCDTTDRCFKIVGECLSHELISGIPQGSVLDLILSRYTQPQWAQSFRHIFLKYCYIDNM